MRFRKFLMLAVAVFSFGAAATAAVPAAAASGGHATAASTLRVGHLDQAAVKASLAAHQGVLTTSEADRLGVRPNTLYIDTPAVRAAAASVRTVAGTGAVRPNTVAQPASHTGCNSDVCIEVNGTGLWVNYWNTWAFPPEEYCSYADFWQDGELAFTGADLCGTYMETDATMETDYDNHTDLCNTWSGISGKPCAEVHS